VCKEKCNRNSGYHTTPAGDIGGGGYLHIINS
jgi:hypothetical protein